MNHGLYSTGDDESSLNIKKVENGWVVTVHTHMERKDPTASYFKALAKALPAINMGSGRAVVEGMDEGMDPYKKTDAEAKAEQKQNIKDAQKVVEEAFAEGAPTNLRKPIEVYCFVDFKKMMAFIEEILK